VTDAFFLRHSLALDLKRYQGALDEFGFMNDFSLFPQHRQQGKVKTFVGFAVARQYMKTRNRVPSALGVFRKASR
jgi:hypothetical protein